MGTVVSSAFVLPRTQGCSLGEFVGFENVSAVKNSSGKTWFQKLESWYHQLRKEAATFGLPETSRHNAWLTAQLAEACLQELEAKRVYIIDPLDP